MKFASAKIELEFKEKLHPEARVAAEDLDDFCQKKGYGDARLVHILRTDDDSQRIYLPIARRVRAKEEMGEDLTKTEQSILDATNGMDDDALAEWARKKPSWHKWLTAFDAGTGHLTTAQRATVNQWVRKEYPAGPWEVLVEDHGSGPHVHLARRSFEARERALAKLNETNKGGK